QKPYHGATLRVVTFSLLLIVPALLGSMHAVRSSTNESTPKQSAKHAVPKSPVIQSQPSQFGGALPAGATCQYTIATGANPIVPGTTDIGNHTDDGDTPVALPFPFQLYDQTFNNVNVSSNGRLDFVLINEPGGFETSCLPATPNLGPFDYAIFA